MDAFRFIAAIVGSPAWPAAIAILVIVKLKIPVARDGTGAGLWPGMGIEQGFEAVRDEMERRHAIVAAGCRTCGSGFAALSRGRTRGCEG